MYSLTSLSWRRKSFLSKQMIVREVDILVIFSIAAIVVSETATVLRVRQQRPPVCARSVGLWVCSVRCSCRVTFSDTMLQNIRFCKVVVQQLPQATRLIKTVYTDTASLKWELLPT